MTMGSSLLLFALGLLGGVFSGTFGIGGAVLVIPMLLYIPPLFGIEAMPMGPITGITMAQVFAASLVGMLIHRKAGNVRARLIIDMGPTVVVGSFVGALLSGWLPDVTIQAVYTAVAILAAILLLRKPKLPASDETPADFPHVVAGVIALAVGLLAGIVGVGGAFILLPIMISWMRVPLRTAVGSSLGIVLLSSTAGLAGKILTQQVPWGPAILVVGGAIVGAQAGSRLSARLPIDNLRWGLAGLVGFVAVRMLVDLLT